MDVLESGRQVTSIDRHWVRSHWEVPVSAVIVSLEIRRGPEGSEGCIKLPKGTPGQSQNLNVGLSGSRFFSTMLRIGLAL